LKPEEPPEPLQLPSCRHTAPLPDFRLIASLIALSLAAAAERADERQLAADYADISYASCRFSLPDFAIAGQR